MDQIFILKLCLTFVVGGVFTTLITVIAERAGSKVGGIIGGLPTTAAISLFFIGFTQTPEIAAEASSVVLLMLGVAGLFLVVYALGAIFSFSAGISTALSVWFFLSYLTVKFEISSIKITLPVFLFLFVVSYFIIEKILKIDSSGPMKVQYNSYQLCFRATVSGLVISLAVLLAALGGPVLGGVFSAFPATSLATLTILNKSGGLALTRAITKPLLVSIMVNISVYAITVRYSYPVFGLIPGTIIAYTVSGMSAYCTYIFVRHNMR